MRNLVLFSFFLIFLVVVTLPLTGCSKMGRFPHSRFLPGRAPYIPAPHTTIPKHALKVPTVNYGSITGSKGANVRLGPGTGNKVIGSIPQGASIKILGKQNNWYNIETTINGKTQTGWTHGSLVQLNAPDTVIVPTQLKGVADANIAVSPGRSDIVYMGYTKDFLPVKQQIAQGQIDVSSGRITATTNNNLWKQDDEFLRAIESGTIMLDQNQTGPSIKNYSAAELIVEDRESESHASSWFKSGGGWLGEVFGNGAMAPYEGEGYEKVLMLNYLSIAYLLQGERKAYNVARRSIDWQNIEKRAFDARRAMAGEKLQEQESDLKDTGTTSTSSQQGIAAVFDAMNTKAKDVPSAYVNPFGFYVTGMIQEYESYQDRSMRDNARISYEKALELNPKSEVLKTAVKDLKKTLPPSGKRLLHVVVADGFAPEKKVLVYNFRYGGLNIPMKLPIFEPGATQVDRIEIQKTNGKRLATLSPIADVEALCIRQQKDSEVIRNLKVALAFSSTAVEKTFLNQLGVLGKWAGDYHDKYREPDTRSWMTLPATIQAARVFISPRTDKVKLVTYSRSGQILASETLNLSREKPNFIYARSIDKTLYAHKAKDLWLTAAY